MEEASVCAICLDKAGNQGPQGTGELNGCSHIFCYSCILEWSNVANSCPLCKQKFTRVTQSQGSVQRVVRVQEREQQHEYDVHELQAAYGDDEEAANNSFIDDRSDAEIEREQAEGADDGDELHWLQSEQERWDRRQGGLSVADHDDTGMAVFSQDGRRLRNTRARKKREAETKRMSQEEAEAAAVLHRGGEGRERKRPRMTRQSTIAEVLEARQQNRRILQQRFTQETSNSNSNNEVVLIGDGDDEEESESNNEHQPSPSSSGGSLSSGSSEQYTPTQLWVVNATEKARAERSAANATITDYFASPQQQESVNAGDSQCTPARSPIQLSPVASSDPTTASLSSCFPLTRSLGLAPSSQSTPTAAVRRTKKSAASSASQRGPQRRKSARSDDKENRPNQVHSLFFSLVSSPSPSQSSTQASSSQQAYGLVSQPSPSPPFSSSPSSFAIPHTPSSRSTSFRVYGTTTATSTSSLHSTSSATSTSTAISSLSSSPSSSPSLPVPSLLTQHQFQALSAVRAELMPFFKKNVLSSDDFRDIAKKVSEQYIVEERNNGLAKKSLCLTPRRKRKIRHLVEQELERFDR